jgi:uncharacterized protein with PIN domain
MKRKRARTEKKNADKLMKQVDEKLKSMPKVCGECNAQFDNTDKETLNEWRLAVYDDGRIHLTCPKCGPSHEEIAKSGAV